MIGLGKVWKAVTRGGEARERPPLSTIPRDIAALKPVIAEPVGDHADIVASETRSSERFVPFRTSTVLTTTNGKRVTARIINVSQTGVAVELASTGVRAEDVESVGSRSVVPGRRIALGMVFLFKKPLDLKVCVPDLIL